MGLVLMLPGVSTGACDDDCEDGHVGRECENGEGAFGDVDGKGRMAVAGALRCTSWVAATTLVSRMWGRSGRLCVSRVEQHG